MADRIVPEAQLRAVASPGSYLAQPGGVSVSDSTDSFLRGMSRLNPALKSFLQQANEDFAQQEEAAGMAAANGIEASQKLEENRQGWRSLISTMRRDDPAQADAVAARSPHFRRGLYRAKAERLGMALDDHLRHLWNTNPEFNGVSLHDVDDVDLVREWVQAETEKYSDRVGVSNLNPTILAQSYIPYVSRAQDGLLGAHTELRTRRYHQDYQEELSAGMGLLMSYTGDGDSSVDSFITRLAGAESGGDYSIVNTLGYTGLLQWGDARLADFNAAHGTSFTLEEFRNDPSLQDKANRWHISDIDREIDAQGFLDKGWSRDGLRAVAHLGGIGGMKEFVMSGGKHSPKDAYGTSLAQYYQRFSSPLLELQQRLDRAVADGIDPRVANETAVASIIRHANAMGDPEYLKLIDEIETGNGKLGNIGWVKDKVAAAEASIVEAAWRAEERALKREKAEREAANVAIHRQALGALLENPAADISELVRAANETGNSDLAESLLSQQERMIDRTFNVRVNHEAVSAIRQSIFEGGDASEINAAIQSGSGIDFPASVTMQLYDDLEQRDRYVDLYDDRQVTAVVSDLERVVAERFAVNDGFERVAGTEKGVEAGLVLKRDIQDFIAENPEATISEVRGYAEDKLERMLKSPVWQPTVEERDEATSQRSFGEVTETQNQLLSFPADPSQLTPEQAEQLTALAQRLGTNVGVLLEAIAASQ